DRFDRHAGVRRPKRGPGDPRGRYPPRRRAGLTVSRFGRKAFRPGDRTATEARVRFPSVGIQRFRLNRSVGAGVEPATGWLKAICSTHLSYPRLSDRSESNRRPPGYPGALPLSYVQVLRSAEHGHALRTAPAGASRARARSRPKGRAYDASRNEMQEENPVNIIIPVSNTVIPRKRE